MQPFIWPVSPLGSLIQAIGQLLENRNEEWLIVGMLWVFDLAGRCNCVLSKCEEMEKEEGREEKRKRDDKEEGK